MYVIGKTIFISDDLMHAYVCYKIFITLTFFYVLWPYFNNTLTIWKLKCYLESIYLQLQMYTPYHESS